MALPQLRDELELHPGPRLSDGQPTWTLHDPARSAFFRIDWATFAILAHWELDDPQAICDAVARQSPLHPTPDDVEGVARFLAENELLQLRQGTSARQLADRMLRLRGSVGKQLLKHYLFLRIPLVNPDRWLERLSPWVAPFYSTGFLQLTLLALAFGLFQVFRRWDQFIGTLVDTISWDGLLAYGAALVAVKFLHELGHAFTAKRFGCRVPAMGVALMVMWPMAFTDTNEVWKLSNSRQRLAVASAGIVTELVIAVWATLAWALLPEGSLKSVAFVLATLSWVATVTVNASPFMRFDGYFIACDWLDMPNLHARAFAMARWDLRERLFDLGDQPPEHLSARRHGGLILFAWLTWVYRLVVFFGIALLVFNFFFKLAGIILFVVEVIWFIVRPLSMEFKVWRELWPRIRTRPRVWRSAVLAALALLLLVVPWPTRVTATGHLRPAEMLHVYAPGGAQVIELPWSEGASVVQGDTLVKLASTDLQWRWQRARVRDARARAQAAAAGVGDSAMQRNVPVLLQEQAAARSEIAGIRAEADLYVPDAPYGGIIRDIEPDIERGTWVRRQERLFTLVKPGQRVVEAFLDEDSLRRIKLGDSARFFCDGGCLEPVALTVTRIDSDATRALPSALFATSSGGTVLVRQQDSALIPERAVYRVTLTAGQEPQALLGNSWRGRVVIRGSWEPPMLDWLRSAMVLVWRESGF